MISWMQKHRKYLVVTIWVSTIAFVGAGFVGWGAYSFNDSSNSVAKVGDIKITIKDLQKEYSRLFATYQQIFNGNFDEEKAKQMRLQEQATNSLIDKAYIMNLAKDLGITCTDKDVAIELSKANYFHKDGKFDKNTYLEVLKNNRIKPSEYETSLKDSIIITKLMTALKPQISDNEKNSVMSTFFMRDSIKVNVIDSKNLKLNYNDDDLKSFWEKNKENYLTDEKISLDIYKTKLIDDTIANDEIKKYYEDNKNNFTNDDGKIKSFDEAKDEVIRELKLKMTKKEANKNFYKFKNDELNATNTIIVNTKDLTYDVDSMQKIEKALAGDILKPIEVEDGYEIVKIKEKIAPVAKSFEEAKNSVLKDYESELKNNLLEKNAKNNLENFDGKNIGFISRNSKVEIDGLKSDEANVFINKLFSKNNKKDFIIIGDKAVVYEIVSQKLSKEKDIDDMFNENIISIKESLLDRNMLKMLSDKYSVEKYVK